jgi:zinc transport system substrate-binding protein
MSNKNILLSILAITAIGVGTWFVTSSDDDHSGHDTHDEEYEVVAKEPVRADGTFSITTSFYPIEFVLGRIVGDLAVVTNVGAGRDPHDFRPSTQDILALQQADLVVLHGAALEPWGDDVQQQLRVEKVPVVLATAELNLMEAGEHHEEHGDEHEEDEDHADETHEEDGHADDHGNDDPHTWLDPVLLSETVMHLTEAIIELDPENASVYETNAAALQTELMTLNTEYETGLATCATDEVVTSHDAFGYVAERYNFTIHTIAGISTQDLPSAQTLASLKEEAAEGVNAILLEANSVTAYGETLANETGLQTLSINSIAFAIPDGSDYLTLMRANLEAFKTALDCNG